MIIKEDEYICHLMFFPRDSSIFNTSTFNGTKCGLSKDSEVIELWLKGFPDDIKEKLKALWANDPDVGGL